MPFHQKGDVRIRYRETGAGFPLLINPGDGLNSTTANLGNGASFNPMEKFRSECRCSTADLRNAKFP